MTTQADVVSVARNLTRDFGTFFEVEFANVTPTLRLPHPLVQGDSVNVTDIGGDTVLASDFAINERNGLLKLRVPADHSGGIAVNGLYYQWFLDEDLQFHSSMVISEHLHHRSCSLAEIHGTEVEVIGIGTLVSAFWSLATELSTDIDVISPEGLNIQARERFNQVMQDIQMWTARYDEKAAMLNVGLKRIEQFSLRRVSRTTNRLVPLYRDRELDNPRPPIRVRPPIDPIEETPVEVESAYWSDLNSEMGIANDGWGTIGTGTDFFGGPG